MKIKIEQYKEGNEITEKKTYYNQLKGYKTPKFFILFQKIKFSD